MMYFFWKYKHITVVEKLYIYFIHHQEVTQVANFRLCSSKRQILSSVLSSTIILTHNKSMSRMKIEELMIWFVWHKFTLSINQWYYVPMPAAARYSARGQPSPPQPTISTEVLRKFSWPADDKYSLCCVQSNCVMFFILQRVQQSVPSTPSSGRSSCLLYRMMSSLLRAALAFRGAWGVTLS